MDIMVEDTNMGVVVSFDGNMGFNERLKVYSSFSCPYIAGEKEVCDDVSSEK